MQAGRGSWYDVRASTWYADGRVFDDHVRQDSCGEIGHEILSTAYR